MKYKPFPEKYFSFNKYSGGSGGFSTENLDKSMAKFRLKYLKKFIMELPKGSKVLDLGAGTGKASLIIRAYRPDVTIYACDISDMSEAFPKDILFKQCSAEELKEVYREDFFDAVVSLHLIEHLVFPLDMMSGVRYILKKGGKVFIETPNWTRLFVPFSYMFFYNDYTHIRPFSIHAMTRLFVEFDIKPLSIKTTATHRWFSKSNNTFKKETKTTSPTIMANENRGFFMRVLGKIINPLVKDVLIAIGEKQ